MAKNTYRKLLSELRQRLGHWKKAGTTAIYRRGGPYLIQCVSCQSSNFSRDYVPATFVQVLAHPGDCLAYDFGGRLQKPQGGDYWLPGDEEPPVETIFALLHEQSWPKLAEPLTLESVELELDNRPAPKSEPHYSWCAGLVYGLRNREDDARRCFNSAISDLKKSRKRSGMREVQWVVEALQELERLQALLKSPKQFEAHCIKISEDSARRIGIECA